ncbi:hypothetical protein [Robiginitomaculum antarcticum]|uniref:hypothetical protein n=1 Tax=Robiginitomaculum antarcticum TaxID=437507 RepID=UPI000360324C|nr:hypothetical protein [Robiginitomaculum antarcticum]
MIKLTSMVGAALLLASFATQANASEVVVMKFVSSDCQTCAPLETNVDTAVSLVGDRSVKTVTIDISNAALWERSAHDAFNANVVPVFNQYVGLTGFAAIVDPQSKRLIGCVNSNYNPNDVANLIKSAARIPHQSSASVAIENYRCPAPYNKF